MSPRLKPLLLPQLVQERKKYEDQAQDGVFYHAEPDVPAVYFNANSSSSDITSPVTPTFSTKGHFRYSSSSSSLDLPPQLQESPVSPTVPPKPSMRQLPDVQEEELMESEVEEEEDDTVLANHFGLYSCLCAEACEHRSSSDDLDWPCEFLGDYDLDYDMDFLSDGDTTTDSRYPQKKRNGAESPFSTFTSRIGSRLPSMTRWKSHRRPHPIITSPATERSLESVVLSGGASSRSSSMSAPIRHMSSDRSNEHSILATPALSFYESSESIDDMTPIEREITIPERSSLERERGEATTPLLPPLLTDPFSMPPRESPLQSPTVAPSPTPTEIQSPPPSIAHFSRPSLSTKPSLSSFRQSPVSNELPLPLPAILQEHDEWSDRLGHANFTITPQPYKPETFNIDALRQLRADWDTARCNYTKHLVRTGENYGETSKIYALTEAKWTETERRWRSTYDELMEHILATTKSAPASTSASRSRSRGRGRGRGRSGSGGAGLAGRPRADEIFAGMEWRRLEDGVPSAVPRLLDADGKFPARGDEDIVGPMQRDEVMVRAYSEERRGTRFWKHLAGKVGLRK